MCMCVRGVQTQSCVCVSTYVCLVPKHKNGDRKASLGEEDQEDCRRRRQEAANLEISGEALHN